MRRSTALPIVAIVLLWLALGAALSAVTRRVADWFVMTDELLYERLALSIARTHSPVPRVHDEAIANLNQLYPLLIAPVFRHGAVLHGFHEAHVLNAFVMSSAAIPAYLLARRVTDNRWLPFVIAVASVTVPWITLSSFLLTEVAAYPAFVWAALAMQATMARPSVRNDVFAIAAIALAVLARTQFYALAVVLPLAILLRAASERRIREAMRLHVALIVGYAIAGLAALALVAAGHGLLGTYSTTASGNPLPLELWRAAPAHLAIVALGGGLLPFIVGGAWLTSNLRASETTERSSFAWLATIAVVVLTLEAASFDLRFGGGLVRERYLFYLTPLLLVAFAAALTAARGPRWSLALPVGLLALGFWNVPFTPYVKLNADTPASVLNDWLLRSLDGLSGTRIFLITAAVLLAVGYAEGSLLLPRTPFTVGLAVLLLIALPAETAYAFKRLYAVNGTSGLPLSLDQSVVFGWVDRTITTNADAMMVPYPVIRGDYWSNIGYWWDFEFWNRTVDREATQPNQFSGTPPGSFPKIDLRFDPHSGLANFDVDSYVTQAVADARFHLRGRPLATQRDVTIVLPDRPWAADWVSYGLYPDGWTRPGREARIRVFAAPGQRTAVQRSMIVTLLAPGDVSSRHAVLHSNEGTWPVEVTSGNSVQQQVTVCVPAGGPADVELRAVGASPIYGVQTTVERFGQTRDAGVLVGQVALDGKLGPTCSPSR